MFKAAHSLLATRYSLLLILLPLFYHSLFGIDPRYHTYGETIDEMRYTSLMYPNITRIYTIGYTTGNQLPMLAIKISDNPQIREDEPKILFNGIHHPAEVIGPEICLTLMTDLVNKYGSDPLVTSIINNTEIWILPMVNPDGNYIIHAGFDTMWRKNTRDNNQNGYWDYSDGVNLNRNYDFLWSAGGNLIPSDRDYRGPYPFSENETQAIRDLALHEKFVFDVCYHSSRESWEGEAVYYPWRWGNPFSPDHAHIRPIADSTAVSIINDLGTATYYATFGRATEGGLSRNWLYYALGTFAFTIEVSHGYFPPGYRVDSICQRNLPGAYYLLKRMLGSQITGHIIDSVTGMPLVAEVRLLESYAPPETIAPRTSDSVYGRFYRLVSPGNYTITVHKFGYQTESIPNIPVVFGQPTYLLVKMKPILETDTKNTSITVNRNEFQVLTDIINNTNKILFSVTQPSKVKIQIYAEDGRLVKEVTNQSYLPGNYNLTWNFRNNNNKKVSAGVYFVKIITDLFEDTKKITVVD